MTILKKIAPEADGVLKDGQFIRVRLNMMDAEQAAIADAVKPAPFVADHHRPNSAVLTDAERQAAHDRQKAADKALSDAWKNPEPIYAGANFPQGGSGHVTPQTSRQSMSLGIPEVGNAPGSAVHAVGAVGVAELDAIQVANQQSYNAKIENAWRNPTSAGAK